MDVGQLAAIDGNVRRVLLILSTIKFTVAHGGVAQGKIQFVSGEDTLDGAVFY